LKSLLQSNSNLTTVLAGSIQNPPAIQQERDGPSLIDKLSSFPENSGFDLHSALAALQLENRS
jgi:hypothetical protein